MPEGSDFQQPALSEGKVAAPKSNSSNNIILPAQIAQNANFLDIFPFEFEANKSPSLFSNTAVNEQKAITAIYIEATTNAKLDWETQKLKILYQGQYTIVPATCGTFNKQSKKALVFEFEKKKKMLLTETYMALGLTSNWANKTEQKIFEESKGWKKVRYFTPKLRKEPLYIPLRCKDCKKKLLLMGACISPEEKYKTHTYYFCKACHRE
ncbi:hypothetical protein G9A89_022883 [Geosiphon pyriformis]|nr:hypothetical protein G9A89_022883 [Geosiphon pyriformis]